MEKFIQNAHILSIPGSLERTLIGFKKINLSLRYAIQESCSFYKFLTISLVYQTHAKTSFCRNGTYSQLTIPELHLACLIGFLLEHVTQST